MSNKIREIEEERVEFNTHTHTKNRILNVGCGAQPTGHVNVDLFTGKSEHRGSETLSSKIIPNLVCADIHYLPFQDSVFDRVDCFELLEHRGVMPRQAIKELLRVTKRLLCLTVPSFWDLSNHPRRNKGHVRVFRSKHLHLLFRNYSHNVKTDRMGQVLPCWYVPFGYKVEVWKWNK